MFIIFLYISKESKGILLKQKSKNGTFFNQHIEKMLNKYREVPVENIADILSSEIQNKYYKSRQKETISISKDYFVHEEYFRKIYLALLTRHPNLKFKEMVMILLELYCNEIKLKDI